MATQYDFSLAIQNLNHADIGERLNNRSNFTKFFIIDPRIKYVNKTTIKSFKYYKL